MTKRILFPVRSPIHKPVRLPGVITPGEITKARRAPITHAYKVAKRDPEPKFPQAQEIWGWYVRCHERGAIFPERTPFTEGGNPVWPEWAWVGALADAVSLSIGRTIGVGQMGAFVSWAFPDVEAKTKMIVTKSPRGLVIYRRSYTMYRIGPFRKQRLPFPSDILDPR